MNASHSHEWIRRTIHISDMLCDNSSEPSFQFLLQSRSYNHLTLDDRAYTSKFVTETIDSNGESSAESDENNTRDPIPNRLVDENGAE